MRYSIFKQWVTLDGIYHSNTTDRNDYDSAIGDFHSMFKPMQNDTNVSTFRITLIEETGNVITTASWVRPVETAEVAE